MTGFEAWVVRAGLAGGLVLLAGWALARLSRGAGRRQVAAAWAVRGAVLAAVAAAAPAWLAVPLPAPAEPPPPAVVEPPPAAVWEWEDEPVWAAVPEAEAESLPPAEPAATPWPAERWLLIGYAAVAGLLLVRLLAGHWALARLARRASPAPPRVKDRLPGRVLVADRVRTPVCFGLLRPTVLLPRGLAETASVTELEWVLRHEADHVRRGDHRSNWWAAAAGCVFFPLPWYWAVRREMRLAQEYLADAAAAGDRPADYAAYLVHLSASPCRLPQLAAGVRAGRSDLSRRVVMLLGNRGGRRASRGWRFLVGGGAVASAVALGGLTVRADEPKPKAGEPVEVRVVVLGEDEKKPEEKKPEEKKPDGDKPKTEVRRVTVRAAGGEDVAKLKAAIKEAAKKGDEEKVSELVDKLEKTLRDMPKTFEMKLDGKPLGEVPLKGEWVPGNPRVLGFSRATGLDEAIKQLQSQLDAMKDGSPQAKQALEKALESLKGQVGKFPQWQGVPGGEPFPAPKPRFGAGLEPIPEAVRAQLDLSETVGVQIADVKPGTPAEKAGLKKGDILTKFGKADVGSDPEAFVKVVRDAKPGPVTVTVLRKGKAVTLPVDLGEAPKPFERARAEAERAEGAAKRAAEAQKQRADADRKRTESRRVEGRFDGADFRTLSVSVSDGEFTAKATNAGIVYTVTGKMVDGKPVPAEIVVKEGETTHTGKAVKDLPENCRNAVERLLKKITPQ